MNRPLNFLHLTTFYPPYSFGGDAMYVYRLAHALGDAGHRVDVIHCIDSYHLLHPAEPEIPFADHPNVTTHGLRRVKSTVDQLRAGRLKPDARCEVLNDDGATMLLDGHGGAGIVSCMAAMDGAIARARHLPSASK